MMKKLFKTSLVFSGTLLLVLSADARRSEGLEKREKPHVTPSRAADCAPASRQTRLSVNNVSTRIETGGSMWQDRANSNADYFVPAGGESTSLYSGSLWMGGQDLNGQLKIAAVTFRNGTNDFWAGPLSTTTAEIDPATCSAFDKFFEMNRSDVAEFVAWWDAGLADEENGTTTQSDNFPDYQVPDIIKQWPGNGDITLDQGLRLAPFFDRNGDGTYDPEGSGDYPYYDLNGTVNCRATRADIPRLIFGDNTNWWVFNDKGNTHTETGGDPIGMEIRAQGFAFATNDAVNDMTFYNYEMINRSSFTLQNTYFGQWVDPDLGCADDDYVGCDVERGLGYCYNGDEFDENCRGSIGYGSRPPAVGIDFFEGPYQDSDGLNNLRGIGEGEALNGVGYLDTRLPEGSQDSIIDNERFGMRRFVYYNRGNGPINDPVTALDHYNYLRGVWRDGTRLKFGGNGNTASGALDLDADFMFPGSTDPMNWGTRGINPGFEWTEQTAGNPAFDRRFLQSAGPFTLTPGAVNDITVGVVWARAATGSAAASVEKLVEADDKAQALFDNCFKVLSGPDAPDLTAQELSREVILYWGNSRASNNYNEEYQEVDPFIVTPQELIDQGIVYDNVYRFQGYQLFQAKNEEVSVGDIGNLELLRPVYQCDVKDGIGNLVNFSFSETMNANVPSLMVEASNEGINHSLRVTEDLFATGDNRLVNYKTYYFLAIAYGYNNFKKYDQNDPLLLDGQTRPYLASRKSVSGQIKLLRVIPHPPKAEEGGTIARSQYGDQPQIIRVEGQGNGGLELELSKESEEALLRSGAPRLDFPKYKAGKGPIDVKVIDPLSVPSGQMSIRFIDSLVDGKVASYWRMNLLNGNSKTTEVLGTKVVGSGDEQLIPEWGLSVRVDQVVHPGEDAEANQDNGQYRAGLITATVEHADSSQQWLTGVVDIEAENDQNWIRAGKTREEAPSDGSNPNLPSYNDMFNSKPNPNPDDINTPTIYWPRDPNQTYETLLDGGTWIAPFALTSYAVPSVIRHAPSPGNGNGKNVTAAKLSGLLSVDIVFTSDKSKWTRCPVLETQDDPLLAVGNAEKLKLRKSQSVDKNGSPDGTGTGMGWFPGYAISLETGERLNMAFGEDSWLVNENGADMKWNPTSNFSSGFGSTNLRWGGKHYIYVFRPTNKADTVLFQNTSGRNGVDTEMPAYDEGRTLAELLEIDGQLEERDVWEYGCIWVGMPFLENGEKLLSNEARIKLRVEKPYERYVTDTTDNGGRPHYTFDLNSMSTVKGDITAAKEALKLIKVVPNPYYAFSEYENSRLDNRIKLTNLPEECTISIYNLGGTLVRKFEKSDPTTSLDWDLRNENNIPIASGVYIIHINAPGIGERIVKWMGILRPVDLESF
jgi:hypothetical protein